MVTTFRDVLLLLLFSISLSTTTITISSISNFFLDASFMYSTPAPKHHSDNVFQFRLHSLEIFRFYKMIRLRFLARA